MKKLSLFIVFGMLALLVASVPALAQANPKIGYNEWQSAVQSRNIPAGTVNDPGSHLTYVLDTGVNARALLDNVSLENTSFPLVDLQQWLDTNQDGLMDDGAITQNFVAITNTNPTMAVTVHFRYYNDNCEDILDFLVILTCNDTLIFDPFNYEIPGSDGENTHDRLIGPGRANQVLKPVTTAEYGSGRFILTAAASGASIDTDWDAEILFPYELGQDLDGECNIQKDGTLNGPLADILSGAVRNVGVNQSLVSDNLHVFNAYQISFNYLIGFQTLAVPRGGVFQAGGVNAWARPAIGRELDPQQASLGDGAVPSDFSAEAGTQEAYGGDGDGDFLAPTGQILLGGERGHVSYVRNSDQRPFTTGLIDPNLYFLRNDVHGGDVRGMVGASANSHGGTSLYGAQGTGPLIGAVAPSDIIMNFVSVYDDYNGSNNTGVTGYADWSANVGPAVTTYVLQIYDNDEHQLVIEPNLPIPVSPPLPGKTVELKMVCACLRTFLTTTIAPQTNVDDLTIQDLADVFGADVLNGRGNFIGLLAPSAADLSGGWIRFVRDNTHTVVDFATLATRQSVGFTVGAPAHGPGTSTFDIAAEADIFATPNIGPSFLTISNSFTKAAGFGALWWNYAVPSDARVSEQGVPAP